MTDEGFVWQDEPARVPSRALRVASPTEAPAPIAAAAAPIEAPRPLELTRWEPPPARSWPGRLVAVARSVTRGRRAMLGACLDVADALAGQLRHVLLAS